MGGVVRGRFDAENLAAQLITDTAGYLTQQQTKSVSDEYHQSKMASQGAGHITQTTIEQQWESQLINDAEFMANRQLPSVTFDINNSDISQQLGQGVGEEVSRFQHVDSPRNPNGFWQRIEQRYKNNFERQALITEGRAAANSEVMSESLGYAAVNQQNYLDLGYSESNAQYGAAWIAMAEVPAAQVVKGIQIGIKVSRLLDADKWWFLRETASEKSARLTEMQYRQMKMLKENTGYNVLPESWFESYPQIGKAHTYITDYEAIAKVLGPVQSNTKIGVNLLFPKQGNISLFKAFKLEYHLGLEYWSLYNRGKGFRFSEVSNIAEKFPRSPLNGNNFFKRGYGLPGMGPEIGIDPISTRPWPWN